MHVRAHRGPGPFDDDWCRPSKAIGSIRSKPLWRSPDLSFASPAPSSKAWSARPPARSCAGRPTRTIIARWPLAADPEIVERTRSPERAAALDVCQVPTPQRADDAHTRLLGQIYRHWAPRWALPDDWVASQVSALDRVEGDTEPCSPASRTSALDLRLPARPAPRVAQWQERTRAVGTAFRRAAPALDGAVRRPARGGGRPHGAKRGRQVAAGGECWCRASQRGGWRDSIQGGCRAAGTGPVPRVATEPCARKSESASAPSPRSRRRVRGGRDGRVPGGGGGGAPPADRRSPCPRVSRCLRPAEPRSREVRRRLAAWVSGAARHFAPFSAAGGEAATAQPRHPFAVGRMARPRGVT